MLRYVNVCAVVLHLPFGKAEIIVRGRQLQENQGSVYLDFQYVEPVAQRHLFPSRRGGLSGTLAEIRVS